LHRKNDAKDTPITTAIIVPKQPGDEREPFNSSIFISGIFAF
jgi:hypothetical protein